MCIVSVRVIEYFYVVLEIYIFRRPGMITTAVRPVINKLQVELSQLSRSWEAMLSEVRQALCKVPPTSGRPMSMDRPQR